MLLKITASNRFQDSLFSRLNGVAEKYTNKKRTLVKSVKNEGAKVAGRPLQSTLSQHYIIFILLSKVDEAVSPMLVTATPGL